MDENIMNTTIQEMRDFWNKVSAKYDSAIQKKFDTRKAFNTDCDRRDRIIRDKVSELEKEIEGIQKRAAEVGGQYGNALSAGNQEEAIRLQAETDSLAMNEFQITRRKETVVKTKIMYDKDLYNAAVKAYEAADAAYDTMNSAGAELETTIERMILELTHLKEAVNAKRNILSSYDDIIHDRLVKRMHEGADGTIRGDYNGG